MTSIWLDPDVDSTTDYKPSQGQLHSLNDKLTPEQVLRMSTALWKLHDTYHHMGRWSGDDAPDRQEMDLFLDQCYELGFVCRDGSDRMEDEAKTPIRDFIRVLEKEPRLVVSLTLRQIRQVTHFLARHERWADGGGPFGSGIIIHFAKSGLAEAFAKKLQ